MDITFHGLTDHRFRAGCLGPSSQKHFSVQVGSYEEAVPNVADSVDVRASRGREQLPLLITTMDDMVISHSRYKLASRASVYTDAIFAELALRAISQNLLVGDSPKPRRLPAELAGRAPVSGAEEIHKNKKTDRGSALPSAFSPVLVLSAIIIRLFDASPLLFLFSDPRHRTVRHSGGLSDNPASLFWLSGIPDTSPFSL